MPVLVVSQNGAITHRASIDDLVANHATDAVNKVVIVTTDQDLAASRTLACSDFVVANNAVVNVDLPHTFTINANFTKPSWACFTGTGTVVMPIAGPVTQRFQASEFIGPLTGTVTGSLVGNADTATTAVGTWAVVQKVTANKNTHNTGTDAIPLDNTIPQNTEGQEVFTATITPQFATSSLLVEISSHFESVVNGSYVLAAFRDTTANAVAATCVGVGAGSPATQPAVLRFVVAAGSTTATTFKFRFGSSGGGAWTFNGISGGGVFGGVSLVTATITEIHI